MIDRQERPRARASRGSASRRMSTHLADVDLRDDVERRERRHDERPADPEVRFLSSTPPARRRPGAGSRQAARRGFGIGRHEAYALDRGVGPGERLLARRAGGEHGAGPVGGAAQRSERRGRARDRRRTDTTPLSPCGTSTDSSRPGRRDEEPGHGAADGAPRRTASRSLAASGSPERRGQREPVQVDARHELDELGVVAAAEPGGDLEHLGPAPAEPQLRVGRAVLDPERRRPPGASPRPPPRRAATARSARARRRTRRPSGRRSRSVTASGTKLARRPRTR